jgi:hypothetical protein
MAKSKKFNLKPVLCNYLALLYVFSRFFIFQAISHSSLRFPGHLTLSQWNSVLSGILSVTTVSEWQFLLWEEVSALYFIDFEVFEAFAFYLQTDKRTYILPPLNSGCTRIDEEHIQHFVMHNFEDMRMTANEQVGRLNQQLLPDRVVVMVRRAAYMFKHDVGLFDLKAVYFGGYAAHVLPVTVAIYGTQRGYSGEPLHDFIRTYVTRMPNFVTSVKECGVTIIPVAVSIRYNPYPFHIPDLLLFILFPTALLLKRLSGSHIAIKAKTL